MTGWPRSTSPRKAQLPANWDELRRATLDRAGGICEWDEAFGRCPDPATDADHIDRHGPHELWNLRALCHHHHMVRTQKDSAIARRRNIAAAKRKPTKHPGLQ